MGWCGDVDWTLVLLGDDNNPAVLHKRESSPSSDSFTTAALNALIVCPFRNCWRVIAMEVAHGPLRVFSDLRTRFPSHFLFSVSKQIERGWQPCMQVILKWMLLRLDRHLLKSAPPS
jgi:hypothetical protein